MIANQTGIETNWTHDATIIANHPRSVKRYSSTEISLCSLRESPCILRGLRVPFSNPRWDIGQPLISNQLQRPPVQYIDQSNHRVLHLKL